MRLLATPSAVPAGGGGHGNQRGIYHRLDDPGRDRPITHTRRIELALLFVPLLSIGPNFDIIESIQIRSHHTEPWMVREAGPRVSPIPRL